MFTYTWTIFFTSVELASLLLEYNTYLTETLRQNRIGIPESLKNYVVLKGSIKTACLENGIRITKYNDKKNIFMISSFYRNTKILKPKWDGSGKKMPVVIGQYNKNMLGVDKGGQINSFTDNSRKSMRWFANVGLELILESCMSNVRILNKK